VFINVIGGMIIGIAQQGMPFSEAARTYTLLTVGDGLVTQVPALIVSTAAACWSRRARRRGGGRQGACCGSSPAIRPRSDCRRR
jgi:flagellar biosynthesis component FlhA